MRHVRGEILLEFICLDMPTTCGTLEMWRNPKDEDICPLVAQWLFAEDKSPSFVQWVSPPGAKQIDLILFHTQYYFVPHTTYNI